MSKKIPNFIYYKKSGDTIELEVNRMVLILFIFMQLFVIFLWGISASNSGVTYQDGTRVSCRAYLDELDRHQEYLDSVVASYPETVRNACEVHCGDFLQTNEG